MPTSTKAETPFTYVRETDYLEVGLSLRRDRKGSESDLIQCFLADLPWHIPPGVHVTVFQEPRLDSGFPDIVLVLWDRSKTTSWPDERLTVTSADIRIAHYLVTTGSSKVAQLLAIFGSWVLDSLERLADAKMIYRKTGLWCPRRLDSIFAVHQIVAFEAKMGAFSEALFQASRNRWFASHSYVIVPKEPRDGWSVRKANQFGIGLWSPQTDSWISHAPSVVEAIPRSYGSWLFNEWAWRLAKLGTGTTAGA